MSILKKILLGLGITSSAALADPTVNVRNNCPFPLWIHSAGSGIVLQPDNVQLNPGESRGYGAPSIWPAARIEAYRNGPMNNQIEKVEATFDRNPQGEQMLHYNVTYVDWVGLPVQVTSEGSGGDCRPVTCGKPVSTVLNGCPGPLRSGDRCFAPRTYCLDPAHNGDPLCHTFDGKINECADRFGDCAGARGSSSAEVFACSGRFFSTNPKYCAALNRGMLNDPFNGDKNQYYRNPPFNEYSKWVHQTCPGIYAFPYDDFPGNAEESGFHSCSGGRALNVTFCPAG